MDFHLQLLYLPLLAKNREIQRFQTIVRIAQLDFEFSNTRLERGSHMFRLSHAGILSESLMESLDTTLHSKRKHALIGANGYNQLSFFSIQL